MKKKALFLIAIVLMTAAMGGGGDLPDDLKLVGVDSIPPNAETSRLYLAAALAKYDIADLDPFYLDAIVSEPALRTWVDLKSLVVAIDKAPTAAMRAAATRAAFRDAPERLTGPGGEISDEEALAYLRQAIPERFPVPKTMQEADAFDPGACETLAWPQINIDPDSVPEHFKRQPSRIPLPRNHIKSEDAKTVDIAFAKEDDGKPCCMVTRELVGIRFTSNPFIRFKGTALAAGFNAYNSLQRFLIMRVGEKIPDDLYFFMTAGDGYFSTALHIIENRMFATMIISQLKIGNELIHITTNYESRDEHTPDEAFLNAIAEHEGWRNAILAANKE